MLKTVTVRFNTNKYSYQNTNKTYDYLVKASQKVEIGDCVLVYTGDRFAVASVVSVKAEISNKATKTVVAVLGDAILQNYEKRNKEVLDLRQKYKRLEELLAQDNEMNKYRYLAQTNKEAAMLLSELNII